MPAPRDKFVDYLEEAFAPLGEISSKRMFGGHCLYCDGIVFALVADAAVYLKADDQTIPEFEARGLSPFRPFPDQDMVMKYYATPPEVFEDPEALVHWVGGAVACGRRAQKPKRKSAKKSTRTSGRSRGPGASGG